MKPHFNCKRTGNLHGIRNSLENESNCITGDICAFCLVVITAKSSVSPISRAWRRLNHRRHKAALWRAQRALEGRGRSDTQPCNQVILDTAWDPCCSPENQNKALFYFPGETASFICQLYSDAMIRLRPPRLIKFSFTFKRNRGRKSLASISSITDPANLCASSRRQDNICINVPLFHI